MILSPTTRVLAIDPTSKGFGFVVLEGPTRLLDWGSRTVQGNADKACLRRVSALTGQYDPEVVVLENCDGSRRVPRVRRLIGRILEQAKAGGLRASLVSRRQVQAAFAPASTKHEIASAIAERLSELRLVLPEKRTLIMSTEDQRMNVFDAAALALTWFHRHEKRARPGH
jgi:Holliday junction resolvasome RuvABC endonuclease subunit